MNNSTEALKRMPLQRFEYMRKIIPLLRNQSEDCLYLNIFTPIVAQTGIHFIISFYFRLLFIYFVINDL
jgi:carboxylesterase type B